MIKDLKKWFEINLIDSAVLKDLPEEEDGTRTVLVMVNPIGAENLEHSDRTVTKAKTPSVFRTDLMSNWRTTEPVSPMFPGGRDKTAKTPSIKDSITITSEQAPMHQQTTNSTDS